MDHPYQRILSYGSLVVVFPTVNNDDEFQKFVYTLDTFLPFLHPLGIQRIILCIYNTRALFCSNNSNIKIAYSDSVLKYFTESQDSSRSENYIKFVVQDCEVYDNLSLTPFVSLFIPYIQNYLPKSVIFVDTGIFTPQTILNIVNSFEDVTQVPKDFGIVLYGKNACSQFLSFKTLFCNHNRDKGVLSASVLPQLSTFEEIQHFVTFYKLNNPEQQWIVLTSSPIVGIHLCKQMILFSQPSQPSQPSQNFSHLLPFKTMFQTQKTLKCEDYFDLAAHKAHQENSKKTIPVSSKPNATLSTPSKPSTILHKSYHSIQDTDQYHPVHLFMEIQEVLETLNDVDEINQKFFKIIKKYKGFTFNEGVQSSLTFFEEILKQMGWISEDEEAIKIHADILTLLNECKNNKYSIEITTNLVKNMAKKYKNVPFLKDALETIRDSGHLESGEGLCDFIIENLNVPSGLPPSFDKDTLLQHVSTFLEDLFD